MTTQPTTLEREIDRLLTLLTESYEVYGESPGPEVEDLFDRLLIEKGKQCPVLE